MSDNKRLIERVAEIYDWLDSQTKANFNGQENCKACGRCCDFDQFDHRLFITTPELMYLSAKSGDTKPMPTGRCPYNIDGKCSIYQNRFAGCRIFLCTADKDFQSRLSESALNKLKYACEEFNVHYCYTDLATALNNFSC